VFESLLILVREGFEATLIVGIVFAYLRRIDRADLRRAAWAGIALAAAVAVAVGVVVHLTVGELEGAGELRAFAAISLVAAAVLTWMVFWMRRQSRSIKGELQRSIDAALGSAKVTRAVLLVAFFAVLREGIETALFLIAAATDADGGDVLLGGVIGLAIACVLGWLVYAGGRVLPMRQFFTVTGMIVIVFAAGLCAKSILFLQASGDLGSWNDALYNLTNVRLLTAETQVGRFLSGLFGWDPRPSAEQVAVWLAYLVPVTAYFLRPARATAD
jgi:high-affinity iron transporter